MCVHMELLEQGNSPQDHEDPLQTDATTSAVKVPVINQTRLAGGRKSVLCTTTAKLLVNLKGI